jgi:predicted lipoprotein with Yx(FWY)xxD motif
MFGPHSRSRAAGRVAGVVLAVGLLASACGGSASTTASSVASAAGSAGSKLSSAADKATSAAAKATSAAGSAASAAASKVSSAVSSVKAGNATGPAEVNTATTSLGVVLVGANGMTLYMYDPDAGGTPTCYDACATAWPPLVTSGAPTAAGQAEANLLTTAARTDGTTQVVYNKWPLYFWQKDTKPGDVTGQAVGGKWWVVGPDGTPIKTPAG